MKLKIIFSIISIILLVSVLSVVYYQKNYKTLDEAISETNVPIDGIFHTTDYKGHTIIFYGKDNILSAGLIEKNILGYRWDFGRGSEHFNLENRILTRSFRNLHPQEMESDDEFVHWV